MIRKILAALLILLASASAALANDWPQAVYGSDIPQNVTVMNVATVTVQGGITVTPPALTTTTFNGTSQPVNITSGGVSTFTLVNVATAIISGTVATSGGVSTMTVVNTATVTFNGTSQPVTVTAGVASTFTLVNVATVAQSGTWSVSSTVVNIPTVTFNGTSQPVNSTVQNIATVTFNGTAQPVFVLSTDTTKATYGATGASFTGASANTDIGILFGSATKVVKVRKVRVGGVATAAQMQTVLLTKRSTADVGASSVLTMVPFDSAFAVATASAAVYTVNPTTGTLVGHLAAQRMFMPAVATPVGPPTFITWDFTGTQSATPILRGVAECLAVNLNAISVTGGSYTVYFEWTEE